MEILPLAICHPDQCCGDGYCIDEINVHGVDRATAEDIVAAVGRLVDQAITDSHKPKHEARPPHPSTQIGRP